MKLSNFLKKANSVLNRLDLILPDEAGKTDLARFGLPLAQRGQKKAFWKACRVRIPFL